MTIAYPSEWWDRYGDRSKYNKIIEIIDAVNNVSQGNLDAVIIDGVTVIDSNRNISLNELGKKIYFKPGINYTYFRSYTAEYESDTHYGTRYPVIMGLIDTGEFDIIKTAGGSEDSVLFALKGATGDVWVGGDLQVNGNDIKDSGGNTRLTLGNPTTFNGALKTNANIQFTFGYDQIKFYISGYNKYYWMCKPSASMSWAIYDATIPKWLAYLNLNGDLWLAGDLITDDIQIKTIKKSDGTIFAWTYNFNPAYALTLRNPDGDSKNVLLVRNSSDTTTVFAVTGEGNISIGGSVVSNIAFASGKSLKFYNESGDKIALYGSVGANDLHGFGIKSSTLAFILPSGSLHYFRFYGRNSGADNLIFQIGTDGKVGIGTASPAEKFELKNTSSAHLRLAITETVSGYDASLKFSTYHAGVSSGYPWYIALDDTYSQILFYHNGDRMRLSDSQLRVYGDIRIDGNDIISGGGTVVITLGSPFYTVGQRPKADVTYMNGDATHRWYYVYTKYLHTGDIVFEERKCAICGRKFKKGDKIALYVNEIDEHGTHAVPIHDRCLN